MGSLGWAEILIILVIALIIFGPRKLPELGKTLGQSLAQFRRASEDFKRTWEDEVEIEKRKLEAPPPATVEYSSTTDPYEGQDFSLDGSHSATLSESASSAETTEQTAEGATTSGEPNENGNAVAHVDGAPSANGDSERVSEVPPEAPGVLAPENQIGEPKQDHA